MNNATAQLRRIRWVIGAFIAGLTLTGLSVFPVVSVVNVLQAWAQLNLPECALTQWLLQVHQALQYNQQYYPFMLYTLDWLGFAHLLIALVFIGAWRDPVRNIWVIEFGMLACVLTFPAILLFGSNAQIPAFWWLLDAVFGAVGVTILGYAHRGVRRLEQMTLMDLAKNQID